MILGIGLSFFRDLEPTCKDHSRRRCWGIGFGLSFRVVALDLNFRKLSMEHIVSAYKRTTARAIILDYDGILMPQSSIDKSPTSKTIEMLNTLCRDKNNMVFVVSAKSRETLVEWFDDCDKLGLAAEHGCFLRYLHFFVYYHLSCRWKDMGLKCAGGLDNMSKII
ncbi:hypothetical protein R6Q59_002751 [Mikania micrantha]